MSDAAWPRILADPGLVAVYDAVLAAVGRLGPYDTRYRKSAVQLVRPDGTGIVAVAPAADGIVVTFVVDAPLTSPRATAPQAVSDGVWNQRVTVGSVEAVDDELHEWLARAYVRP